MRQPELIHSHKWEANGIAVWDNRSTLHYALADYWPSRRVNHRVTFNARGDHGAVDNTLAAVGGTGRQAVHGY
ncbi:Alpha-ketoglutarate-dependent taurine dioxygenase [compost metagenome]